MDKAAIRAPFAAVVGGRSTESNDVAAALAAGSCALPVTITDTAGVDHITPSNGDGARVTIHPRFGG